MVKDGSSDSSAKKRSEKRWKEERYGKAAEEVEKDKECGLET